MKIILPIVLIIIIATSLSDAQRIFGRYKRIFVKDSVTAIKIAVAAWNPNSKSKTKERRTYHATLIGDSVWHVSISGSSTMQKGGGAEVKILKRDGRILGIIHGK